MRVLERHVLWRSATGSHSVRLCVVTPKGLRTPVREVRESILSDMRILVVAATNAEISPLSAQLRGLGERGPRLKAYAHPRHEVEVLITGVGMVATGVWCSRALATAQYDMALNLGVCGSFVPALAPGSIVHVTADRLSELGAEDGDAFLSVQELALLGDDEFPFRSGLLVNSSPPASATLATLPAATGITVSTVHGNACSIAATVARFRPDVESMEGASFMYACLVHGVPFAQVRAVSNMVERRNRSSWRLGEAIHALADASTGILGSV